MLRALIFGITMLGAVSAHAELIVNGSFEQYGGSGNSNIGAGLTGWTIGGGGVDIVLPSNPNYWQAQDGEVSITLNWASAGSISQTVATTVGQVYELSYYMAAELVPGGPPLRTLDALWNGAVVEEASFLITDQTSTNPGWVLHTLTVVGTGSDVLTFASTTFSNYGPALDSVSLVPTAAVPEPASAAMGLIAIAGVAVLARRRA